MSRSRSRGPTPAASSPSHMHSTGRGGAGNIHEGDAPSIETVMENDNFKFSPAAVSVSSPLPPFDSSDLLL